MSSGKLNVINLAKKLIWLMFEFSVLLIQLEPIYINKKSFHGYSFSLLFLC